MLECLLLDWHLKVRYSQGHSCDFNVFICDYPIIKGIGSHFLSDYMIGREILYLKWIIHIFVSFKLKIECYAISTTLVSDLKDITH